MGSIFTSQYPSVTGITWANNHSKSRKFFENIKLGGYELHATFPTGPGYDFFQTISKSFKKENCDLVDWKKGLFDGIDEIIHTHLTSKKMKSPWFYYIHLMDMHLQRSIPSKFKSSMYGKTFYERKLALIDFWLGEFFKLIDLNDTMLILTSDHGEYVLDNEMRPDFVPILQQNSQIKKNKISNSFLGSFANSTIPYYLDEWGRPRTVAQVGLKIMRTILTPYRQQKFRRTLDEYQIRSTYKRGKNYLFDEAIRIPLLFIGAGVEHSGMINDLVRHVDIFPTLAHLMNIPINQKNIDGRNLLNLMNGKSENEIPAIIESMPLLEKPLGDVIGVRTSKYKYFRSRVNPKLDVSLFDLVDDPKEIKNIASSKPDIIIDMELILTDNFKNIPDVKEEITNDKKKLALKTLKEMGYD
jgi:arylsulfatase A-like enzyme